MSMLRPRSAHELAGTLLAALAAFGLGFGSALASLASTRAGQR